MNEISVLHLLNMQYIEPNSIAEKSETKIFRLLFILKSIKIEKNL